MNGRISVAIPGLYIPNAFSPNNDGSNDRFGPLLNDAVQAIRTFSIFDRWGASVFTTNDQQNSWDGRINGTFAAPGNYVYFVEWVDLAGNVRKETGEVLRSSPDWISRDYWIFPNPDLSSRDRVSASLRLIVLQSENPEEHSDDQRS